MKAVNKKTEKVYNILFEATNCTDGQEKKAMIVYERKGFKYVREKKEFFKKFDIGGERIANGKH